MKLVRVRGASKRRREPVVLGVAQFHLLLRELDDPFRTMVILDLATGFRCSERFALQWRDVLWEERTLLVRRAIVTSVVSDVKTKYSNAGMPLDWPRCCVNGDEKRASRIPRIGCLRARSWRAGNRGILGAWSDATSFLQPFVVVSDASAVTASGTRSGRSLDETGAPMKVQQELMRHADIRTTMNVYGKAMDASKREAHAQVVRLVLPAKVA